MEIGSNLGVNFSLDYAKYNAIKGESGSYTDFLLHYDAEGSQNGDESWMYNLLGGSDILNSLPAGVVSKLDSNTLQAMAGAYQNGSELGLIDSQINSLKLQLISGFKSRYENSSLSDSEKNSKIASIYQDIQNVKLPSRFL